MLSNADQTMRTAATDSFDNENAYKQKAHKKDKQWTISNTLEESLLQD